MGETLAAYDGGIMTAEKTIVAQVLALIRQDKLSPGTHLPAQMLADRLRVSRSPINEALVYLHEQGLLRRERNRGFFVDEGVNRPAAEIDRQLGLAGQDAATRLYFQVAEDRLKGDLPEDVTEVLLKTRYKLTPAQLQTLLGRIAKEGWIEKKPGYGWAFSPMLTTPDSLLQSYRMRLALEPAALLEPGYRLDPQVLARCRAAEIHLLEGGIETDTADQLHERGVNFHESLVAASGNAFFIDSIRRVNRVRRLLSYRSMQNRQRYPEHCQQHLHLLDLLEQGRNADAAAAMREHLSATLQNHAKIRDLLGSE